MRKNITNWVKDMFSDEEGAASSKRFVGIISAFVLWVALLISVFTKKEYVVDSFLAEIVALLAFGSLGLSSFDKFSWRNNGKKTDD